MSAGSTPVKVTIFVTRKGSVTETEFHDYWTKQHSKVVSEWLQRHGVLRYAQFHTPSWAQQKAQASISVIPPERYAEYDGFVELVMTSEKCFEEAREDPYYEDVVKADEERFIDTSKSLVVFGWEEVYIEGGRVLG